MSMALDKHLKSDFFEGTEKLLEMWFNTVEGKDLNLRVIQRSVNLKYFHVFLMLIIR